MPDIATISSIIGSVKAATDIARMLKDSDLSVEKAELKLKLADLVGALADTKLQIAEIQELLSKKNQRILELEEAFQLKDTLIRSGDAYYDLDDSGKAVGEPYCMHCWETKHKAFHLHREVNTTLTKVCPSCKTKYQAKQTQFLGVD